MFYVFFSFFMRSFTFTGTFTKPTLSIPSNLFFQKIKIEIKSNVKLMYILKKIELGSNNFGVFLKRK